jgi:hypothetical protein
LNVEETLVSVLSGGLVLMGLGWVWLIVRAFGRNAWWGVGSLIVPPFAFLFALRNAQRSVAPLVTFALGNFVAATVAVTAIITPIDLQLRERLDESPQLWVRWGKLLRSDAAYGWMENRAIYLEAAGLALVVVSWIWLLVRAFRYRTGWGLISLFMPPAGLVFAGRHPRQGTAPLIALALGLIVAATPAAYILAVPLDLGEHERIVNGERHLTLTGWDRKDYSILVHKPDVVVLQMANPDVTDASLEPLEAMTALRELDLNGTQISDAGLKFLEKLPALATLRVARTTITDAGFRRSLFAKDSLEQLDLTGTQVSVATVKAWREAKKGRQALP